MMDLVVYDMSLAADNTSGFETVPMSSTSEDGYFVSALAEMDTTCCASNEVAFGGTILGQDIDNPPPDDLTITI